MHAGAPTPTQQPSGRRAPSLVTRWGTTGWALVGVTAALALVAWGLSARGVVRLGTARPNPDLVTTGVLFILVLSALVAVPVLVSMSRGGERQATPRSRSWRDLVAKVVTLALVLLVASRLAPPRPQQPKPSPGDSTNSAGSAARASSHSHADWSWVSGAALGVLLLAVAVVVCYGILRTRRMSASAAPPGAQAQAPSQRSFVAAAAAGRRALDAVDSDRAAVIACYSAMQTSLASQGVPVPASDTTADLLDRSRELGLVHGPAADRLADLFRHARYCADPLPPDARETARSALRVLGAESLTERSR